MYFNRYQQKGVHNAKTRGEITTQMNRNISRYNFIYQYNMELFPRLIVGHPTHDNVTFFLRAIHFYS